MDRPATLHDDNILWNLFRDGDEHAYTELARRYYRTLLTYGHRFTPNQQVVEDTLQDLLIHLWLHRESINDTPHVRFYLLKAFRHRMLKTIRPLADVVEFTDEFDEHYAEFSKEDLLIQHENSEALTMQVRNVMEQLPVRQQEVIYLRFFQNLRTEEIASLLSINPQSVSNITQRALSNLRKFWPSTSSISICFCWFSQIFA
ncbi:RNA polymerase sigma factor [Dyadobacter luticola]|uniref:RNA polymerase sigma factor n=1 Tax=Dyadobacter luticola TaxID=1979387 RepID=UPI001486C6E4|nr:sigma-70 family RNA polymerase sigma factor [Dyadobacter luticola]